MKCKHCKLHVENAFNEKDGNWAEVNLEKKESRCPDEDKNDGP